MRVSYPLKFYAYIVKGLQILWFLLCGRNQDCCAGEIKILRRPGRIRTAEVNWDLKRGEFAPSQKNLAVISAMVKEMVITD